MKTCSRCGLDKSLGNFYFDNGKRGPRYAAACKLCTSQRTKEQKVYSLAWIQREQEVALGVKTCPKCKVAKDISEYKLRDDKRIEAYCPSYTSDYNKEYRAKNSNKQKDLKLRRLYGITYQERCGRILDQEGKCASCGDLLESEKKTHVDHCHDTGRVRGILCHHCNVALGHLREDRDRILNLLRYIDATS